MFVWLTIALSCPFKEGRFSSSFSICLLQAVDGVMYLALCPQVVSQAPQHFRSSEMQAICVGCFSHQSICSSVISLHSGMSNAVHPQEFLKLDVSQWHIPIRASHSTVHFCLFVYSKLTESVRMMVCVVRLSPPVEAMCDCFHSVVKLGVEDRLHCVVNGGHTFLDSEAPPWLIFGDVQFEPASATPHQLSHI